MKAQVCPVCKGKGKILDKVEIEKNENGNSRQINRNWRKDNEYTIEEAVCHGCSGMGWVNVPENIREQQIVPPTPQPPQIPIPYIPAPYIGDPPYIDPMPNRTTWWKYQPKYTITMPKINYAVYQ